MVPDADRGPLAFVLQDTHRARVEQQLRAEPGLTTQEHRCEHAQAVTVPHEGDIALGHRGDRAPDHARRPGRHLLDGLTGGLARRHPVLEHGPVVADLLTDLRGGQSFVGAVVPLQQVVGDLGIETGELGGAAGALQGRGKHEGELTSLEQLSGGSGQLLAVGRERDVGAARVLSRERPLGLSVTQQDETSRRWAGRVRDAARHAVSMTEWPHAPHLPVAQRLRPHR